ncbi:hypothetical protein vseg_014669 [Gypsophila vaccaria]
MNTQMERPKAGHTTSAYGEDRPHDHDVGLHLPGHDEGEQHGEKKSVLKKVKAKAKKIKDTITGHGGHGHDHDEDDDDDEMDTDRNVHGAPVTHVITKEGITRQHGVHIAERTAISGHAPGSNPGAYQVFETTTTQYVPSQEETLDWSRTDTGTLPRSENQPHERRHTPGIAHSSGTHSTGDLGIGHKPKLGGILEKDTHHVRKDVTEDVRPVNYQTNVGHSTGVGKERVGRQHGTDIGRGSEASGPGGYQVFDPKATHYEPGQEETLGWSRTDTGTFHGSEDQPRAHRHTPDVHSSGIHTTGDSRIGHKPKLGGILEKDAHMRKDVGDDIRPANYQATVGHPTGAAHGVSLGKERIGRQHGTDIGGGSDGGGYQDFHPKTTHYVPGQEETLGWSRTDTGTLHGSEDQPRMHRHTPDVHLSGIHSTGDSGIGHKPKIGGIIEKDSHMLGQDIDPANYQPKLDDSAGAGYRSAAGQKFGLEHRDTGRHYGSNMRGGAAMEEGSYSPVSQPLERQTFDTTGSRYIPGQDEAMGWSVADIGRTKLSEEQPFAPKNTPIMARPGHHRTEEMGERGRLREMPSRPGHHRSEEMGEPGKLREMLDRRTNLEKDPHAPRDVGENRLAENYQSKVIDPTGRGGEEIGVTPILHQLGKMNVHDESTRETDSTMKTGQREHLFGPGVGENQNLYTGSHDQFSPEPVTNPQFDTIMPSSTRSTGEEEHKPESYTNMISSAASELANKAKQATGTVTSKLGYGGYSETPEGRLEHGEDRSVVGSIGDYRKKVVSTVQEKIAPVYDKVAGLGSSVSSKVQGSDSAPEHDVGSTTPTDKGVSVKEYLVDKLKPGEGDKALSKAITDSIPLHKSEENPVDVGNEDKVTEVTKVVIKGRVTESEEVANRLGRSEDKSYDGAGPGLASPGKSVMDRICDAAGSWFTNTTGDPGTRPESGDYTEKGDERTRKQTVGEAQQNQNVGEVRFL